MSSLHSEFTIPYTNQSSNIPIKFICTSPYQYFDTFSINHDTYNNNERFETLSNSQNLMEKMTLEDLISAFKIEEKKDKMLSKKHLIKYFETIKLNDRGRKRKPEAKTKNNKIHGKYAFDNLLTKIQVHFLTFLIDLSNEALKTELGRDTPYNFKYIPYNVKKNVKFDYLDWIKNISIKDILQMKISKKFSTFDKDINKKTLNIIYGQSNWLDAFFNMKYMEAFNYYYNNSEAPLKKIEFKEKTIDLSNSKIEAIYGLLKKNESMKTNLIATVNIAYFNGKKYYNIGKNSFTTNKIEIEL